jgi:hypothetical protein
MKQVYRIIGILTILGAVVSCTTFQVTGVQMNKETPAYEAVGQFWVEVTVHEFLGSSGGANLFNVTATEMNEEILKAIRFEIEKYGGDAAVNVQITYEATFIGILLNAITWSIYAPARATIRGTVVKFQ